MWVRLDYLVEWAGAGVQVVLRLDQLNDTRGALVDFDRHHSKVKKLRDRFFPRLRRSVAAD